MVQLLFLLSILNGVLAGISYHCDLIDGVLCSSLAAGWFAGVAAAYADRAREH